MRGFIAPTDHDWYKFLRARPEITEVNFWRPGGVAFHALSPGEPFFFKLKHPYNAIGGFGIFARAERLPVWRAWDVFTLANGATTQQELLGRLQRLLGAQRERFDQSRLIGCIAIIDPVFFTPDEWVASPNDWSRNIVSGRTEDLSRGEGQRIWLECLERAAASDSAQRDWAIESLDAHREGKPALIIPRLGQSSFRLAVLDAYGHQCAVTGEHSEPVIEAAHIRPWASGGTHSVPNGLPLRRDLHRLFDLGYVTIRPNLTFAVSRRLHDDYANGRIYYELEGRKIILPHDRSETPDPEALEWHGETVFLGS